MKNIAVMGARGFIGKNTVSHLRKNKNWRIFPVTRENLDLLDGELVKAFLDSHKIDIVIHCANQGGSRKCRADGTDIVANNLRMFFNVERCITPNRMMINFGSGAQYDKDRDLRKVREDEFDASVPKDAYGYSKYVMSKHLKCREKDARMGSVYNPVIFGMFGIGEDYTLRFISNAILKNLLGLPIVINQDVIFDYLYIEDYFRILDALLEGGWKTHEFNLTPTESVSLTEITEIINKIGKRKSEVIVKHEGMNHQYTGDNSLLLKEAGCNFSFTPYSEAIEEMYWHYSERLDGIDVSSVKEDSLMRLCKTKPE